VAEYKWLYRQMCPDRHNWPGDDYGKNDGSGRTDRIVLIF